MAKIVWNGRPNISRRQTAMVKISAHVGRVHIYGKRKELNMYSSQAPFDLKLDKWHTSSNTRTLLLEHTSKYWITTH